MQRTVQVASRLQNLLPISGFCLQCWNTIHMLFGNQNYHTDLKPCNALKGALEVKKARKWVASYILSALCKCKDLFTPRTRMRSLYMQNFSSLASELREKIEMTDWPIADACFLQRFLYFLTYKKCTSAKFKDKEEGFHTHSRIRTFGR